MGDGYDGMDTGNSQVGGGPRGSDRLGLGWGGGLVQGSDWILGGKG